MTHDLKTWTEFFQQVLSGKKTFEIRKNDRDFKVGDTLTLMEYFPEISKKDEKEVYGDNLQCTVTYIFEGGAFGLEEGYCCMAIANVKKL